MLSPSIPFQINMLKATAISYYYTFVEEDTLTLCLSLFCLPTAPRPSLLMTLTPLSEIKGKQKQQIYPPYKIHTLESDYSSWNPRCTVVDRVACIWTWISQRIKGNRRVSASLSCSHSSVPGKQWPLEIHWWRCGLWLGLQETPTFRFLVNPWFLMSLKHQSEWTLRRKE